jgi:hypothetical protein
LEVKRPWVLFLITANLIGLVGLSFFYPHLMVSPGPVTPAHTDLATDCFSCHAPLRGAVAERCVACHTVPSIGQRTTKGVPLANATLKMAFHQELNVQNCMACHSGHQGSALALGSRQSFSHDLLRAAARDRCEACHTVPATNIHRNVSANCGQCHSPQRWKPATFDHGKLFLLDGVHDTTCATCHSDNNYSRYTCYGCHEHQADRVRAKHLKEGIRSFENCVECHRNASGEHGERGSGERRERD